MATAEVKEEQEVYVCLPRYYYEGEHILSWALSHFPKDKTKIVATVITDPISTYHRVDRRLEVTLKLQYRRSNSVLINTLDQHLDQCARQKFEAEKLVHKNVDQVEGILELIDLRAIKNLVMGLNPNSRMFKYVANMANPSCKIWFISEGNLLLTRYPKSDCTEATSEERIRREKLHQEEIEEIQKRENDKNDLLKRENEQLKLENQLLRNQRNDNLIELEDLNMQKQQLENKFSDLEIDYNKLKQEHGYGIKEAQAVKWPLDLAEKLAKLGLRCADIFRRRCPDMSQVWTTIELLVKAASQLKALSSVGSSTSNEEYVPSHFICPIMKEIMKNPCIAADGFTYEAEAIKTWLNRGHNTSPMTNLVLPHQDLIPNHVLRSAIQEWLQQHPQS